MEQTVILRETDKSRRVYGFDEVALAPSALSVDPRDVDTSWQFAKFSFRIPVIASVLHFSSCPKLAVEMQCLGGLSV